LDWLKRIQGTIVGIDTAPLIYFIEEHPKYLSLLDAFFLAAKERKISLVTSSLTITEVLVHPLLKGNMELVNEYKSILLSADGLEIVPINNEVAETAAGLRAKYKVSTPDALQIAAAFLSGAKYFLTNDLKLKHVQDLNVLCLNDLC
jgi:predicted nucleic acid-binding protein